VRQSGAADRSIPAGKEGRGRRGTRRRRKRRRRKRRMLVRTSCSPTSLS
jgi:hypothetical protein